MRGVHFKNSDRQGGVQFSYEIILAGYSFHTPHFSEPPPPRDVINDRSLKRKRCDKNISKRKTSPAGVGQVKEKKMEVLWSYGRNICVTNHKWNHLLSFTHLQLPLLNFLTQLMMKTLKMVCFSSLPKWLFVLFSICGVGALFHSFRPCPHVSENLFSANIFCGCENFGVHTQRVRIVFSRAHVSDCIQKFSDLL